MPAATPVVPIGSRKASGVGVFAGLLTLAVASIFLGQNGAFSSSLVGTETLEARDCANLEDDTARSFDVVPCTTPHNGEVVAIIVHPDAGAAYPGDEVTAVWFEQRCESAVNDYLGDDVMTTTLSSGVLTPSEEEWGNGSDQAACYITTVNDDAALEASVEQRAEDFRRDGNIPISQLAAGDCFSPADERNPFELRSGDIVELTECEGQHHGVFFGRGTLPYPTGSDFPETDDLTTASTRACATRFEAFFEIESSLGYTFRFWRPSRSDWDADSRDVLCAVLSDAPLEGNYTPAEYPALANLGTGQCFQLLPEQEPLTVSLDDHVRPVVCSKPHVGQMIGTGELNISLGFPGDAEAKVMTERECRDRFETFVGLAPSESSYGRFPYWFPDETSWSAGDARYACAILGDQILTSSVQHSRD